MSHKLQQVNLEVLFMLNSDMYTECFCQKGVNFLRSLALQEKKLDDSLWPDVVEIKLAIRHMNRPFFPMTLSIPSCDIGKYVGVRTYQLPFILIATSYHFIYHINIGHSAASQHLWCSSSQKWQMRVVR